LIVILIIIIMEEASDGECDGCGGVHSNGGQPTLRESPRAHDPMLAAEGSARRLEHEKAGMREGYEAGKEETVQEGFNQGFGLASSAGFAWGRAMAAAAVLDALDALDVLDVLDAGVDARQQVKESVCGALWEAHGEAKDRFPEHRRANTATLPQLDELNARLSERIQRQ
jgi:hypothetical protein